MKKNLLRIAFIIIALGATTKGYIMLTAYQIAEAIQMQRGDDVAIDYDWLSSDLKGRVTYQGLELRPYVLKRSFQVESVELNFGSYLNLLLALPKLKDGDLSGLKEISLDGIAANLEGRDLEQWLALEYGEAWLKPLGLYACGPKDRVDEEALSEMKIDEIRASARVSFSKGRPSDFKVEIDAQAFGRFNVGVSDWSVTEAKPEQRTWLERVSFSGFELTHVDGGYLRRLSNYCEAKVGLSREDYALAAADAWSRALQTAGMVVSPDWVSIYQEYMQFGGALSFKSLSDNPLNIAGVLRSYDSNLVETLDLAVELNGSPVSAESWVLSKVHFDAPAKIEKEQKAIKPLEEQSEWQALILDDIDLMLGQEIQIEQINGKRLQGILSLVDEFELTLKQNVDGGELAYVVKREEIKSLAKRNKRDGAQ